MVEFAEPKVAFLKAVLDRLGRQPRPMFDAAETLLFRRSYQLSIADQASRRITMICVEAQDCQMGDRIWKIEDRKPEIFDFRTSVERISPLTSLPVTTDLSRN